MCWGEGCWFSEEQVGFEKRVFGEWWGWFVVVGDGVPLLWLFSFLWLLCWGEGCWFSEEQVGFEKRVFGETFEKRFFGEVFFGEGS